MVTKRTTARTSRRASAAAASDTVAPADAAIDSDVPSGASEVSIVRVEMVDPATLLVDVNVRLEARLDADFVASVRDLGVLVPVVAVRTAEGQLRVRFGHRRTLAAVQNSLPTIPVVVAGDEAGEDDAAGQVARLLGQWAENEHRAGLTTAERVGVVSQLAAFGVTPAQIAKRTRLARRDVDAALIVAKDDLAAAATVRYDFLDLLQASVVAEMSDDTDAVKALVAAARTGQFDHVAQRLRDTRSERRARDAAADVLRTAGVQVIDRPEYGTKATRLGNLTDVPDTPDTDRATRPALTVESHADCPGHAAYLTETWVHTDRPAAGTRVSAVEGDLGEESDSAGEDSEVEIADVDGDSDGDSDDDSDDDDSDDGRWEWTPVYVCTDPTGNGHHPLYGTINSSKPTTAEMTDEQREAARAERRDVIESNKAWDSAEIVRRDWLRGFLARKTPPKGTAAFVAVALAQDVALVADSKANHLAADLLALPATTAYGRHGGLVEAAGQAAEPRATVIALAQVLAGYEAAMDRTAWRNPRATSTRYLTFLAGNGYTLSQVEERARLT
ncbi:ParB N-terminal domain-containing protein [Kineosporia sp. R_H_3]|uniref:ParB/RepB/Spo0J family partition protein n=1 Tax=Kineosporia sp. R_H_3 TaxID=1961848 RepID=UPI001E4D569A|nr:ParB N-terminal domain-containing protein [Kineosporia sp. R_H_3]